MSAAAFAERLARLAVTRGDGATCLPLMPRAVPAPGGDDALADLMRRVARLRASAPKAAVIRSDEALAARWGGRVLAPGLVAVERRYPLWHRQGAVALSRVARLGGPMHECLRLAEAPDPARLVFFDTETTGLAGGAGTLAFMVGLGRIEGPLFALTQLVLTRFAGEPALFEALASRIDEAAIAVSYNGKSYDLPLLLARARLAGRRLALAGLAHVDLLHVLRRRHGRGLPDCRLLTAEQALLRFARQDDLPGAEAPRAWTAMLKGDDAGMAGVLRHNRDDILSMAALLARLAEPAAPSQA